MPQIFENFMNNVFINILNLRQTHMIEFNKLIIH